MKRRHLTAARRLAISRYAIADITSAELRRRFAGKPAPPKART